MSVPELARLAVRAQLAQLREHEPGVRQGDSPESVHRMRVASRRLRAILRVVKQALPPSTAELPGELRWLARALGEVRDADVELGKLYELASQVGAQPAELEPVLGSFRARRAQADTRLQAALDAPRFALLLTGLEELAEQAWPDTEAPSAESVARRSYKRLRKAGGKPLKAQAAAEDLHRTRVQAKQMRYTLELLVDVYGTAASRLIKRATRLQDTLGQVQDATVLEQHLREARTSDGSSSAASVFLLGQLTEACNARGRAARARAPRAYRRLTGRAWKRLKAEKDLTQCSPAVNVP